MNGQSGYELKKPKGGSMQIGFQSKYYDTELGLYYYYHRYYDPQRGRFLTEDPIGIAGGLNLYRAFGNNPVNFVDPWGLWCIPWFSLKGKPQDIDVEPLVSISVKPVAVEGVVIIACQWTKKTIYFKKIQIIPRKLCYEKKGCRKRVFYIKEEKAYTNFITIEKYEIKITSGFRWFSGRDIENGDSYCCFNPFTGGTFCSNY